MGLGDTLGVLSVENGGTGHNDIVDPEQAKAYLRGKASTADGSEFMTLSTLKAAGGAGSSAYYATAGNAYAVKEGTYSRSGVKLVAASDDFTISGSNLNCISSGLFVFDVFSTATINYPFKNGVRLVAVLSVGGATFNLATVTSQSFERKTSNAEQNYFGGASSFANTSFTISINAGITVGFGIKQESKYATTSNSYDSESESNSEVDFAFSISRIG